MPSPRPHLASTSLNASWWSFAWERGETGAIRVPLRFIDGLATALLDRYRTERARAHFARFRDLCERTRPTGAEMLDLIRADAFDGFDEPRTAQLWHLQLPFSK